MSNSYSYNENKATFKLNRLIYYFHTLFQLIWAMTLTGLIKSTVTLLNPVKTIYLKNFNLHFDMLTFLDILTLKEVVIDQEYFHGNLKPNHSDHIIVDIGAGYGDFSILCRKLFPNTSVFAFEPDREYFSLLEKNIESNSVSNIVKLDKAIGSLKDVFNPLSLSHIDFLKIDCEGCEFGIFNKKSIPYLRKIDRIAMEYHESSKNKKETLITILQKHGFTVKIYPRKEIPNIGLMFALRYE